jgi:UDP-2,4-diacetamido-2,4,6-trideoxy-beta-L-altropyranose hydrolase
MEISQRTASLGDAVTLLEWRNHPTVRKFSTNSEIITRERHLVWLSNRLQRLELEPFFVYSLESRMVGMSRLDIRSDSADSYEISILVDPSQHGKGFGTRIVDMTCISFFNVFPSANLVARVHEDNFVSKKLFLKTGFELLSLEKNYLFYEKSLKLGQVFL